MKISNPFKRKSSFPVRPEHKVTLAFTSRGVDYYKFDDAFNIPATRALSAITFYKEFEMGCDREYLKQHIAATEKILAPSKTLELNKLIQLNNILKERVEFIYSEDLYLKLASVLYFDKSENPYIYDFKYGREKIERWKKDSKALDFFLQTHIESLLPSSDMSQIDSKTYSQVHQVITKKHSEILSSILSKSTLTKENTNQFI